MNIFPEKATNQWFYTSPPLLLRFLHIFVNGDMVVLLPFTVLILVLGLWSLRLMVIAMGLYIGIRNLGEIMYWLLQQFGPKTYRPYDYGYKKLDNNAVYILYQTYATAFSVIGFFIAIWGIYFW